jgi:hypothetical protein
MFYLATDYSDFYSTILLYSNDFIPKLINNPTLHFETAR